MAQEQFLLVNRTASRAQRRVIAVVAIALPLALIATLPFRNHSFAPVPSVLLIVNTMILLGHLLTAALLIAQGRVLRSRGLIVLAAGYLFTALILIPYTLMFPSLFSATGLLGARPDSAIWLYCFWHAGLPAAIIAYRLLRATDARSSLHPARVSRIVSITIASVILAIVGLSVLVTLGHPLIDRIVEPNGDWPAAMIGTIESALFFLIVAAIGVVMTDAPSVLDHFLALSLWVWLIEFVLSGMLFQRYTGGWYVGRIASAFSGLLVLTALISETSALYARLALAAINRRHERESRLVTMDAVAASIAHEVRQPLTAVVNNARSGLRMLRQNHNLDELQPLFTDIVNEGNRAANIVDGMRGVFAGRVLQETLDLNALVHESLSLLATETKARRVLVQLALAEHVLPVSADRARMQQVLLNLFSNALDAMSDVDPRARTLTIRTEIDAPDALLTIEDSGPGVAPAAAEQIFDAFYTTKADGTGMGLYLCRSIVEQHGGQVWASTAPSSGARFHVRLRLASSIPPVASGAIHPARLPESRLAERAERR